MFIDKRYMVQCLGDIQHFAGIKPNRFRSNRCIFTQTIARSSGTTLFVSGKRPCKVFLRSTSLKLTTLCVRTRDKENGGATSCCAGIAISPIETSHTRATHSSTSSRRVSHALFRIASSSSSWIPNCLSIVVVSSAASRLADNIYQKIISLLIVLLLRAINIRGATSSFTYIPASAIKNRVSARVPTKSAFSPSANERVIWILGAVKLRD